MLVYEYHVFNQRENMLEDDEWQNQVFTSGRWIGIANITYKLLKSYSKTYKEEYLDKNDKNKQ